jgi:hypothetical protein
MTFEPQITSDNHRINARFKPPLSFIAATVNLAMVSPTQRNGELIAGLAAERTSLCKSQVMCVRWLPAADKARVFGNHSHVISVPNPAQFRDSQNALIDPCRPQPPSLGGALPLCWFRPFGHRDRFLPVVRQGCQFCLESCFDLFRIRCV